MKRSNQEELEEKFIQCILDGADKIEAYRVTHPNGTTNPSSEYVLALRYYNKLKSRINERMKEATLRLQEKQIWTKEKATKVLSQIIDINSKEQMDVLKAYDFDIAQLEEQLNSVDENDTITQAEIVNKINAVRKKKKMNKITNDAIINASSELNKIHGLNEQTVKLEGNVQFVDLDLEE